MPEEEPWVYPPSHDPEVQASREATGQMFMTFKAGFYNGWHTSMNASHKMPKKNTHHFAPPPDEAIVSADESVKMVAIPMRILIEGDEDIIRLNHPHVNELTHSDWNIVRYG